MRQKIPKCEEATSDSQSLTRANPGVSKPTPATKIGSSLTKSRTYKAEAARSRDNIETSFFQVSEVPERKKMQNSQRNPLPASVRSYTMPQLSCAKCYWYISFNAFDPTIGKLRRKRIRISPKIAKVSDRRKYANDLLERITLELQQGWNPWVNYAAPEQYSISGMSSSRHRSTTSTNSTAGSLADLWTGYGSTKACRSGPGITMSDGSGPSANGCSLTALWIRIHRPTSRLWEVKAPARRIGQ